MEWYNFADENVFDVEDNVFDTEGKLLTDEEMAKKKGPAIVSSKNELVQTIANNRELDFILNPVSYTQIRGNFSLVQTNLMIARQFAQLRDSSSRLGHQSEEVRRAGGGVQYLVECEHVLQALRRVRTHRI